MFGPTLPLRALVVFEASARLGSFRAAAEELGLTPSAVSHQIRLLEAGAGVRLFERVGRGVELSPDGESFFESLRDGVEILRRATAELAARRAAGRSVEVVRLQTPPSLAGRWLLPRLPALLERHPTLDIRVTADGDGGFDAAACDLAIVYGCEKQWARQALPLLNERIHPFCSPALLRAEAIRAPGELLRRPLIATRVNLLSWATWFRRQGLTPGRLARIVELDPSDIAIDAAVKGLGVVLESDLLTEEETRDGRLVPLFPESACLSRSYWLAPSDSLNRPGVTLLRDWLIETAACAAPA